MSTLMPSPDVHVSPLPSPSRLLLPPPARLHIATCNMHAGIGSQGWWHHVYQCRGHLLPTCKQPGLVSTGDWSRQFDIVGVQEMDEGSWRTRFKDQWAFLKDAGAFEHHASRKNRMWGPWLTSGVGWLSRLPLQHVTPMALPGTGRGVVWSTVHWAGRDLRLGVVHMALSLRKRQIQIEALAEAAKTYGADILLGDFNCVANAPEMTPLYEHAGLLLPQMQLTYPRWRPTRSLDHILCCPDLKVHAYHVHAQPSSDHCAVSAHVSWR